MLLATGMFFFQDTYFSIGGMELSLKNPCALAILFLALLNLTVTVRLDRLLILSRHTAVQTLPCLVPLVFSSVVWVGTQAVIYEGGLGAFLKEFCTLLITFSKETGPLMERLETHDLTFAFGPFLIYLLLHWKKSPHPGLWLGLSAIFFLIGLKRIAIPAVALLFGNVTPYYEISFTYMGRGTGFERFVEWFTGVESSVPLRTQTQIHNDFLRMYLNIGFVGYWVWLWGWLPARLSYWFRRVGKDAGCLFLGICVYCLVLYATDNAIYYPYTMTACALVPMACRFDAQAEAALERRCAQWSAEAGHGSRGAV